MIIILIAIIIGFVISTVMPESPGILGIYMVLATFVVVFLLYVRRIGRCPKCKKLYAMHEISRTLSDIRDSTERVLKTYRDPKTGYKDSYTDIVPATIHKYDVIEECRYCGYHRHKTHSEKIAKS